MPHTIYVRMKKTGRQRPKDLEPVPYLLEKKPDTVRELLLSLTSLGVKDYNERKEDGRLLQYLTKDEIASQASAGKVSFGTRGGEDADEVKAAANTIQCFEDGIYRVFAGDQELTGLDQCIPWTDDMVFTFIRLTMLSGF